MREQMDKEYYLKESLAAIARMIEKSKKPLASRPNNRIIKPYDPDKAVIDGKKKAANDGEN